MEYGPRIRFILFSIAAVLLLVLSAWGIVSIAHRVFRSNKTIATQSQKINLDEYARGGTNTRITVSGPIVADEKFVSYQIDISANKRELKTFRGYERKIVDDKIYTNNSVAYSDFLKALTRLNFTTKLKDRGEDEHGYCATGSRYTYELYDVDEQILRSWSVSCGNTIGSYGGPGPATRALFKTQIPDYTKTIEVVGLE